MRVPHIIFNRSVRGSGERCTHVARLSETPAVAVSPQATNHVRVRHHCRLGALARLGLAAPLLAGVLLVAAPASHASAASCYGNGCNNKDPYATGCAQGAYEITSLGRYLTIHSEGPTGASSISSGLRRVKRTGPL